MIFSPVPDMICGLGLEADDASVPLCCFRRQLQQFSGFRRSSSRGAALLKKLTRLHHRGGGAFLIPLKMEETSSTRPSIYGMRTNLEDGARDPKTRRGGINSASFFFYVHAYFLMTQLSQIECEQVAARLYLKVFR